MDVLMIFEEKFLERSIGAVLFVENFHSRFWAARAASSEIEFDASKYKLASR
jgi:hypothetical protein